MSNYKITIRVLGPNVGDTCRPPWVVSTACQRPAYYAVVATSDNGSSTGGNVCPEHLFPAIGHHLGLPSRP
jgi:hypothetical protein